MSCEKCAWTKHHSTYLQIWCKLHKRWVLKNAKIYMPRRAFEALRKKIREAR